MSGDWLKMEVDLPEKPEVWQIAGIVGLDADAVVGKLLKVWRWFDAHTESGNAFGVTYALVDHVTGVTGFGEAMALCGWLLQEGSFLRLPNFDRHNGKTAKNRALTAKRVAKCKEKGNGEGNGVSVTTALPREEKRREEIKDSKPIPLTAIRDAYNSALPMLNGVRKISGEREKHLRARWNDEADRQTLEYWVEFFNYVAQSDFLTGRNGVWTKCDFDWLINETNHVKVAEGKYENREAGHGR